MQELIRGVLRRHPEIKLCIIFGSVAAAKDSPHSDVDIAVAAEQPLSGDRYLELIEEFSAATGREIDLVDLACAAGLILNQALSTGTVLQNQDKSLYAHLISRMLFDQADMMPYHDRILQERRNRFIHE